MRCLYLPLCSFESTRRRRAVHWHETANVIRSVVLGADFGNDGAHHRLSHQRSVALHRRRISGGAQTCAILRDIAEKPRRRGSQCAVVGSRIRRQCAHIVAAVEHAFVAERERPSSASSVISRAVAGRSMKRAGMPAAPPARSIYSGLCAQIGNNACAALRPARSPRASRQSRPAARSDIGEAGSGDQEITGTLDQDGGQADRAISRSAAPRRRAMMAHRDDLNLPIGVEQDCGPSAPHPS